MNFSVSFRSTADATSSVPMFSPIIVLKSNLTDRRHSITCLQGLLIHAPELDPPSWNKGSICFAVAANCEKTLLHGEESMVAVTGTAHYRYAYDVLSFGTN